MVNCFSYNIVPSSPLSFMLTQIQRVSTWLMASWLPPDFENGNIVAYTLFCRMALDQEYTIRGVLNSSTSSATIMDLMPFTSYECYVTANTSVGEGPPSNNGTAMTDEDGKINVHVSLTESIKVYCCWFFVCFYIATSTTFLQFLA